MILTIFFFQQKFIENVVFTDIVMYLYFFSLLILFAFGAHGFVMVYHYMKQRGLENVQPLLMNTPVITVQLPLFNELYVTNRLIDAVCALEYPKDKLEVQVLDDSTDETVDLVEKATAHYRALGYDIKHIHRIDRSGYKAGALKHGLETARGEFIAVFDADFVPNKDFLIKTIPYFFTDPKIGVVQTRWEHLNREYSMLTRTQAFALDRHFV